MKIKVLSDLHLTPYSKFTLEYHGEDVLILAGDICDDNTVTKLMVEKYLLTFPDTHVIFVPGNHEYYGHGLEEVDIFWRRVELPTKFHYLQDSSVIIGGYRFHGATMWTDMRMADPDVMYKCKHIMNDYTMIRKLTPKMTADIHFESKRILQQVLQTSAEPMIVITHHLPSTQCIAPRYKHSWPDNYAFAATDLEEELGNKKVLLWCHGHMHSSVDKQINGTHVVCNPLGYSSRSGKPENKMFKKDLLCIL